MTDSVAWVSALGSLSTGLAAVVAGWAAVRGLGAWRAETVGRRKAELAEEVLAQFYRARDLMTWARFPGDGTLAATEAVGSGAPVERLARESQLFSELQASRYRFMAYFGEEAAKPFDELRKMHKEVLDAADSLARADQPGDGASHADRAAWSAVIGRGAASQGDELAARLDRTIREIERICRPLIDEGRRAGFFTASPGRRKRKES
jgi:hypothetical protein